jgi:cytoskeleton protein RodZ
MEETPINTMPAEDHVPALRLGATLREKRIAMGLSVADVAAQIRLAPRQIEALEADDLAHLPELPFVRGFVRSYAKLLQLDDQPLLATLPDPHAVSERIEPESVEVPFNIQQLSARQNQLWLYASGGIAVLAAIFALWHFNTPKVEKPLVAAVTESSITLPALQDVVSAVPASDVMAVETAATPLEAEKTPPVVVPVAKPTTTPVLKPATSLVQPTTAAKSVATAQATPTATDKPSVQGAPTRLRIVFAAQSWTEVKDATGRLMSSKMNESGTELNLNGQAPYELIIGNAHYVQLYRRGKLVDLNKYINATSEVARLTLE